MINVYVHKGETHTVEGADEAFKLVYGATKEADTIVVRINTDSEFLGFMAKLNEKAAKALQGSQLIGGATTAWVVQPGSVFAEVDGWRIIVNKASIQQQMMPQPNGMQRR